LVFPNISELDASSLNRLLKTIRPHEVYNLGAQSHVKVSFEIPEYTAEIVALGTTRLLEAIRDSGIKTKFYQASSSEMFGNTKEFPQTEKTPFLPRSPYAAAKVYAHWMTVNYREAYNIFACNGIMFNHESPRRGETFVTRKITMALAKIKYKVQKKLYLGNLESQRDWGFAGDYVEAMWRMLQQNRPDDYIIATGKTHSVKEFLEESFSYAGLDWRKYVVIDKKYFRPTEVDCLIGNSSKAKRKLKWKPKVNFKALVRMMVDADIKRVEQELFGSIRRERK